jgi:hypothetical protein
VERLRAERDARMEERGERESAKGVLYKPRVQVSCLLRAFDKSTIAYPRDLNMVLKRGVLHKALVEVLYKTKHGHRAETLGSKPEDAPQDPKNIMDWDAKEVRMYKKAKRERRTEHVMRARYDEEVMRAKDES